MRRLGGVVPTQDGRRAGPARDLTVHGARGPESPRCTSLVASLLCPLGDTAPSPTLAMPQTALGHQSPPMPVIAIGQGMVWESSAHPPSLTDPRSLDWHTCPWVDFEKFFLLLSFGITTGQSGGRLLSPRC